MRHRQTFSWSIEHMEANRASTLLWRMVFRRTRDQERMATHYSEELQQTTPGRMSNSRPKSAPTGHCHTNDGAQTFFFVEGTPQLSSFVSSVPEENANGKAQNSRAFVPLTELIVICDLQIICGSDYHLEKPHPQSLFCARGCSR